MKTSVGKKALQLIDLGNVMNPPFCSTFWALEVEVKGFFSVPTAEGGGPFFGVFSKCQAARIRSPNYASSEDTITRVA